MKLKKTFLCLGALSIVSAPIITTISFIPHNTNKTTDKDKAIIKGQQYLTDYYNNLIFNRESLSSLVNRQIPNFGIVYSVKNINVKPDNDAQNQNANFKDYLVSVVANGLLNPTYKKISFKTRLNLANFSYSYQDFGPSFSKKLGTPLMVLPKTS